TGTRHTRRLHSFPTRRSSDLQQGALTVSPTNLDFGSVHVGQTAGPLQVTVSNNGSAPASLDNLASSDSAYAFTSDCGETIAIGTDRKSTRLNSSHVKISYAVF